MVEEAGGRFLGQKGGKGLQLEKNEVKMGVGLSLAGQSRTHTGRVSRNRGLLGGVRRRRLQE